MENLVLVSIIRCQNNCKEYLQIYRPCLLLAFRWNYFLRIHSSHQLASLASPSAIPHRSWVCLLAYTNLLANSLPDTVHIICLPHFVFLALVAANMRISAYHIQPIPYHPNVWSISRWILRSISSVGLLRLTTLTPPMKWPALYF